MAGGFDSRLGQRESRRRRERHLRPTAARRRRIAVELRTGGIAGRERPARTGRSAIGLGVELHASLTCSPGIASILEGIAVLPARAHCAQQFRARTAPHEYKNRLIGGLDPRLGRL